MLALANSRYKFTVGLKEKKKKKSKCISTIVAKEKKGQKIKIMLHI